MTIENEAFKTIWTIIGVATGTFIVGPILSSYLYRWAFVKIHPYKIMVGDVKNKNNKTQKPSEEHSNKDHEAQVHEAHAHEDQAHSHEDHTHEAQVHETHAHEAHPHEAHALEININEANAHAGHTHAGHTQEEHSHEDHDPSGNKITIMVFHHVCLSQCLFWLI